MKVSLPITARIARLPTAVVLIAFLLAGPAAHSAAPETPTAMDTALEAVLMRNADKGVGAEMAELDALRPQALRSTRQEQAQYWMMLCLVAMEAHLPARVAEATGALKELAKTSGNGLAGALASQCEAVQASTDDEWGLALKKMTAALPPILQVGTTKQKFSAVLTLAGFSQRVGKYDEAMAHLQQGLTFAERLADQRRIANTYQLLSDLAVTRRDLTVALDYIRRAYSAAEKLGLERQMMSFRISEGGIYSEMGQLHEARAAYERALETAVKQNLPYDIALLIVNLGDVSLREKNWRAAEQLSRDAIQRATEANSDDLRNTATVNLAFALAGQQRLKDARPLFESAVSFYESRKLYPDLEFIYEEWSRALASNRAFEDALTALRKHAEYQRKVLNRESEQSVAVLQQKFEKERKQKEVELLSRENALKDAEIDNRKLQLQIWTLIAVLLMLLSGLAIALYRRVRQANRTLAEKNKELHFQSTRDALTHLYNRRYFHNLIESVDLKQDERRNPATDQVRALYLLDVDHFKRINDRHGHAAGDAVLIEIARRLSVGLREHDVVVRWGGEEFLVFAQYVPNDMVQPLAARMLHLFSDAPVMFEGKPIPITTSVGYSLLPLNTNGGMLGWERALNVVDMALYLAKAHGRNRAYGITRINVDSDDALADVENDLENAWKTGLVEMQVTVDDRPAS